MAFKQLFYTIFKTLNPESYKELNQEGLGYAFKYFLFVVMLMIIVMFLLFIPALINFPKAWDQKMSNLDSLNINMTYAAKQDFILSSNPLIRVMNNDSRLGNEKVLITPQGVYYRTFFMFGSVISRPLNRNIDAKSFSNLRTDAFNILIFILPSLFFWSIIGFSIYFILAIIITFFLSWIFTWSFKIKINPMTLFRTSIFACTIMIIIQLGLMPFYRMFLIPIAAYWLLMLIIIIMLRDELQPQNVKVRKGQSHEDHVDIDDYGNMKSPRRKKSFDDENDGYVEMK